MKKNFVIVFIVSLCIQAYAGVNYGQLDHAFISNPGDSRHQFFIGFDGTLFAHGNSVYADELNLVSTPFYLGAVKISGITIDGSPAMLIPQLTLAYYGKWVVKPKLEIGIEFALTSPNPGVAMSLFKFSYAFYANIWGPGVAFNIGIKRLLSPIGGFEFAHKVNIGLEYTGDLHGGIFVKNALYFSKMTNSVDSYSLVPFITAGLKFGMSTFGGSFSSYWDYYRTKDYTVVGAYTPGVWITLSPGFEYNRLIRSETNFLFSSGVSCYYEMDFVPHTYSKEYFITKEDDYGYKQEYVYKTVHKQSFTFGGKIVIAATFGIGGLVHSKKAKIIQVEKKVTTSDTISE